MVSIALLAFLQIPLMVPFQDADLSNQSKSNEPCLRWIVETTLLRIHTSIHPSLLDTVLPSAPHTWYLRLPLPACPASRTLLLARARFGNTKRSPERRKQGSGCGLRIGIPDCMHGDDGKLLLFTLQVFVTPFMPGRRTRKSGRN